jgi:hypothetical protein
MGNKGYKLGGEHRWTVILLLASASCAKPDTIVQVGENTFSYQEKIYRIIDNEITELGSLRSDSIPRTEMLSPTPKNFGSHNMDYIKSGAKFSLVAVYRGDMLYYMLELRGLNNLRDDYSAGSFTLSLVDEYGFQIHAIEIPTSELVRIVGEQNATMYYQYNGKTQMSAEMHKAITQFSVSSSIRKKNVYGW